MEHRAGVPKGGTFVLVYIDKNEIIEEQTVPGTFGGDVKAVPSGFETGNLSGFHDLTHLEISDVHMEMMIDPGAFGEMVDPGVFGEMVDPSLLRGPEEKPVQDPLPEHIIVADFRYHDHNTNYIPFN